ncbi:hypothetical protein Hanom_Chr04g00325781 [Helianthus anomalus]
MNPHIFSQISLSLFTPTTTTKSSHHHLILAGTKQTPPPLKNTPTKPTPKKLK